VQLQCLIVVVCHELYHDGQMVELARLLAVDDLETCQGANQIHSLKCPGETRWGSHLRSICIIMDMFNPVSTVHGMMVLMSQLC
jgi:hypothetical protein